MTATRHGGRILADQLVIQGTDTVFCVPGESFLAALDGSCRTPIGGLAEIEDGALWFRGEIIRPDGSERLAAERRGPLADAARMGRDAAEELRARAGPGFFDA